MKKFLFPFLITTIALVASYTFYILWHTETPATPDNTSPITKPSQTNNTTVSIKKFPLSSSHDSSSEEIQLPKEVALERAKIHKEAEIVSQIPTPTPKQIQTKAQKIYEALTPEAHTENVAETDEAFEALDTYAAKIDEAWVQESEEAEEARLIAGEPSPRDIANQIIEEEISEEDVEEDLPIVTSSDP